MERQIDDRKRAEVGIMRGRAVFSVSAGESAVLAYREEGMLTVGGRSFPAERRYQWRFTGGDGLEMLFEDGRLLGAATLPPSRHPRETAAFEHLCGADRYVGRLAIDGPDEWRLAWRVAGPQKDYSLESFCRRLPRGR